MTLTRQNQLMPKYAQVMTDIIGRIERHEWTVGEAIPAVPKLAEQYAFNRLTILKALNGLAREGYLSVEQGRGTFVKRQKVHTYFGIFFGDDIFDPTALTFCSLMARAAQDFFNDRESELKFYIEHSHLIEDGILDRDLVGDIERGLLRGLLTVGSNAPPAMARSEFWKRRRIPWVDVSVFGVARHRVVSDRMAMIEMGLDYIRQTGRRRVGGLGLGKDEVTDDLTPFQAQARQRGLMTRPEWLPTAEQPTEPGGYEGMRRIWCGADKPDALLIMDDIVAKGAVQAMLALGLRVPDQLVVIGHANKGSGIFYPVQFPKIEFDPSEIMDRAGEMLLELTANPGLPPKTIVVSPQLRTERQEDKEKPMNEIVSRE